MTSKLNWRGVALMATNAVALVILSIFTPGVGVGLQLLGWVGAAMSGASAAASVRRLASRRTVAGAQPRRHGQGRMARSVGPSDPLKASMAAWVALRQARGQGTSRGDIQREFARRRVVASSQTVDAALAQLQRSGTLRVDTAGRYAAKGRAA